MGTVYTDVSNAGGMVERVFFLVAEDDLDDQLLIERAFSKVSPNAVLEFVTDGKALLEKLECYKSQIDDDTTDTPNIIILDLNMPIMDGKSALKKIKACPTLSKIPVIVFSTSDQKEEAEECYVNGASSFIVKPAEYKGFVNTMKNISLYWEKTALLPSL